jgi:hypothetical protein
MDIREAVRILLESSYSENPNTYGVAESIVGEWLAGQPQRWMPVEDGQYETMTPRAIHIDGAELAIKTVWDGTFEVELPDYLRLCRLGSPWEPAPLALAGENATDTQEES